MRVETRVRNERFSRNECACEQRDSCDRLWDEQAVRLVKQLTKYQRQRSADVQHFLERQVLLSARSPGSCQTLDTHIRTRWLFLEMNQRPGENQVTCHKISAANYIECLFTY